MRYHMKLAKLKLYNLYNKLRFNNFNGHNLPSEITINVNRICNLRCIMCDYWKNKNNEELTAEQWIKIIRSFKKWLGYYHITISGGEPLLKKDLQSILKFVSNQNLPCNLLTNGSLLTKDRINELIDYKLDSITISLDGLNELHDKIRGIKGIWKSISKNIIYIKNNTNIRTNINTVIMKKNHMFLEPLIVWVYKNRLNSIKFQPVLNVPGKDYSYYESLHISRGLFSKECASSIDNIIYMKKMGCPIKNSYEHLKKIKLYFLGKSDYLDDVTCKAGTTHLSVNSIGIMRACRYYENFGSLLDRDPKKIWFNKESEKLKNKTTKCKNNCALLNCNFSFDNRLYSRKNR